MEESGNPEWSNPNENKFKPRYGTSIITNTLIIILFFFTFCQIKGCSGKYTPVTGFQLSWGSLKSIAHLSPIFLIFGGVLIALIASILSLCFCFGNPEKMARRAGICGIVGGLGITIFIILCMLEKGVIIEWPPFLVAILDVVNIVYYFSKPKIKEPPQEETIKLS